MDARACGRGLMRGIYTLFTTENIFGTFQIPVDSFNETPGGGSMVIATSNRNDSSPSPTNQRQHEAVYQTPRFRSPHPYSYRHARVAASSVYGKMTEIAKRYRISRTFLYRLLFMANL